MFTEGLGGLHEGHTACSHHQGQRLQHTPVTPVRPVVAPAGGAAAEQGMGRALGSLGAADSDRTPKACVNPFHGDTQGPPWDTDTCGPGAVQECLGCKPWADSSHASVPWQVKMR